MRLLSLFTFLMLLVVTGKFSRQVLMITTKFTDDASFGRHKKTQQTYLNNDDWISPTMPQWGSFGRQVIWNTTYMMAPKLCSPFVVQANTYHIPPIFFKFGGFWVTPFTVPASLSRFSQKSSYYTNDQLVQQCSNFTVLGTSVHGKLVRKPNSQARPLGLSVDWEGKPPETVSNLRESWHH